MWAEGLVAEAPFSENDVGRPTSKIWRIRQVFKKAHNLLDTYAFSDVSAAHNILGRIIGVSDAVSIRPYCACLSRAD